MTGHLRCCLSTVIVKASVKRLLERLVKGVRAEAKLTGAVNGQSRRKQKPGLKGRHSGRPG